MLIESDVVDDAFGGPTPFFRLRLRNPDFPGGLAVVARLCAALPFLGAFELAADVGGESAQGWGERGEQSVQESL